MIYAWNIDALFFSYLGSTLAVASSRINILLPFKIALAKQISCRWPALKFVPPSIIFVFKPPAKVLIVVFNSTCSITIILRGFAQSIETPNMQKLNKAKY